MHAFLFIIVIIIQFGINTTFYSRFYCSLMFLIHAQCTHSLCGTGTGSPTIFKRLFFFFFYKFISCNGWLCFLINISVEFKLLKMCIQLRHTLRTQRIQFCRLQNRVRNYNGKLDRNYARSFKFRRIYLFYLWILRLAIQEVKEIQK